MTTPMRTAVQGTATRNGHTQVRRNKRATTKTKVKVIKYQPPEKGLSTLWTAQKRTVYEQEHQTKVHHLCGTYDCRNRLRICAGKRHRGHQRSHLYGEFVFDPGTKLIYAIGAVVGLIGGVKVYGKFSSGDPDTSKTAASWFGACIFLIVAATILRSFFL